MLYEDELWINDIDTVLKVVPEISQLENKSVLITGAAGLVCSPIVDIFFRYNDTHRNKIKIYVAGRWIHEMEQRFQSMIKRKDFVFVSYDAARIDNKLDFHADYIIHGASNASPDMILKEPVETMSSNILGIKGLLDYAVMNKTKRVLYISSSEVYGKKNSHGTFQEEQYGYIDILNPRNSYSVAKRASEALCSSYSQEYGLESVIVRPGHIYGPTASPNDRRVSSAWAYAAAYGNDIVMKSDGAQIRSYCYCLDCCSAIIKVLLRGKRDCAYNISNKDSIISIKEMAKIISQNGDVNIRFEKPTDAEQFGFNPMSNSSLDSTRLYELGWYGCFNAETGFAHTIKLIKEHRLLIKDEYVNSKR